MNRFIYINYLSLLKIFFLFNINDNFKDNLWFQFFCWLNVVKELVKEYFGSLKFQLKLYYLNLFGLSSTVISYIILGSCFAFLTYLYKEVEPFPSAEVLSFTLNQFKTTTLNSTPVAVSMVEIIPYSSGIGSFVDLIFSEKPFKIWFDSNLRFVVVTFTNVVETFQLTLVLPEQIAAYSCADELNVLRCHFPKITNLTVNNIKGKPILIDGFPKIEHCWVKNPYFTRIPHTNRLWTDKTNLLTFIFFFKTIYWLQFKNFLRTFNLRFLLNFVNISTITSQTDLLFSDYMQTILAPNLPWVFLSYNILYELNLFNTFFLLFDVFYIYVLLLILLIILILCLTFFVSPKTYSFAKFSPYECGFDPYGDARTPFDINFYLVAILFLIFDLEIILLFLWVYSPILGSIFFLANFCSLIFFFFLLGLGFVYEWYSGGLDWATFTKKRLRIY